MVGVFSSSLKTDSFGKRFILSFCFSGCLSASPFKLFFPILFSSCVGRAFSRILVVFSTALFDKIIGVPSTSTITDCSPKRCVMFCQIG